MQKYILGGIGGLLIGLIVGFFAANRINQNAFKTRAEAPALSNAIPGGTDAGVAQAPASGGMQPLVAAAIERAKNEPRNPDAQLAAGEMYAQISSFDKAKEFIDKAAASAPGDFEGNIRIANAYFDIKQFESAGRFYSKALEINPKDINARTDLGTTYVERPNPDIDQGIKEFQESLKLDPKHEPTLYNLGIAYSRKGDAESAKKTLEQLEAANPTSPLAAKLRESFAKK